MFSDLHCMGGKVTQAPPIHFTYLLTTASMMMTDSEGCKSVNFFLAYEICLSQLTLMFVKTF